MTTTTLDLPRTNGRSPGSFQRRETRILVDRLRVINNRLNMTAVHAAGVSARHQADERARQVESAWDRAFFG